MATVMYDRLKKEFDEVTAAYNAEFAGQPRRTRDEKSLEALVRRAREVVRMADAVPASARDKELEDLRGAASAAVTTYESEREAIAQAKAAGPAYDVFAPLGSQANFVFAKYRRHFQGRSRTTRDLGLLDEMIEELEWVSAAMQDAAADFGGKAFPEDRKLVADSLAMYRAEREAIAKAIAGGTPEQQSDRMAELANAQFDAYRSHFANRSRVTRRPALLQRVIKNLERVRARMSQLGRGGPGNAATSARRNLEIVDGNLKMYRAELDEIRKAREANKLVDLMGALGGEANEIFKEYDEGFGGKDRKTVDPEKLSVLCDRLGEIARQMRDLGRAEESEMNAKNLDVVTGYLATFEQEYDMILEARGSTKG